jgi:cyanophycinase
VEPVSFFALLGSGEFLPWTSEVDDWLFGRVTGEGVLILPTASAPEGDAVFDRWGRMGVDHYARAGVPGEVVPLKTRDDALRDDLAAMVDGAAVVYFSGGNPAYLAATLRDTPFWEAVLRGLERGMAYAGCSAGISSLGEVAPDSTSNDPTSAHFWRPGLALFPKTYFGPHWDALDVYVPGLRQTIIASIPADCRLLAVDEDTAVVGDGTEWSVIGRGRAALLQDGEWSEFPSGTSFAAALLAPETGGGA